MKSISKKVIVFLSLVATIALCSVFFAAAEGITCGDYAYEVTGAQTAKIVNYKGNATNLVIPSELDGYTVTYIDDEAFAGTDSIVTVTIPDSVTDMGFCVFNDSDSLQSVDFGSGITSISIGTFGYCSGLTSFTVSENITTICDEAFDHCENLSSIIIPASVTSIGERIFGSDSSKVTIYCKMNSVAADYAEANNIKYIFTDTIKSGDYTYEFTGADTVRIVDYKGSAVNLDIPSQLDGYTVNYIDDEAFAGTDSLVTVTIPDSVTDMGFCVFNDCDALENVTFGKYMTSISIGTFGYCAGLKSFTVPDHIKIICAEAFDHCDNLESVTISTGVSTIGNNAFAGCEKLSGITIPYSVDDIGESVFANCTALDTVVFYNEFFNIDSNCGLNDEVTIVGYKNSTAQELAEQLDAEFVDIETVHTSHEYKTEISAATLDKNGRIRSVCICGKAESSNVIYRPVNIMLSNDVYTCNGSIKKPAVIVENAKGEKLIKGTDYTATYEEGRTNPGIYTVTVDFIGKYNGTQTLEFFVKPRKVNNLEGEQTVTSVTLSWDEVFGADGYRIYKFDSATGKYKKIADVAETTLKIKGLKSATKYQFRVRAYVKDDGTIYGSYSEVLEITTKPKAASITSVKSATKGKVNIEWTDVSRESKYQLYYATSKNGTYKKYSNYDANDTDATVSGLTSGKTYYFKVRSYKNTDSGKVYSLFSTVKSVKVK